MRFTLGLALIAASIGFYAMLYPWGGKEARLGRVRGMVIVLPLMIVFGLVGGGMLIYSSGLR